MQLTIDEVIARGDVDLLVVLAIGFVFLALMKAAAGAFIETLRGIQTLKLYNHENEREGQWLNRYADIVNANVSLGRAKIAFSAINDVIFGLETVITIYLAARLALTIPLPSARYLPSSATSRTSRKKPFSSSRRRLISVFSVSTWS